MSIFDNYEPQKALYYFERISSIPRDSLKEHKVADYLMEFAVKRNLEVYRDDSNNIIIKKPASKGYESCKTIILQGHMDMVCLKEEGYEHDFENDGLDLYIENGLIKARGTTLGADNGIALAYGLAILDSDDIKHPPLEVVFTTAEEIGMVGAKKLDMSNLSGELMISFDSGGFTEGRIYVGCAGGERITLKQNIKRKKSNFGKAYEISISGLKGGHAGGEISKGRGNGTILLGRLLSEIRKTMDFELIEIQGGDRSTTIKHSIPDRGTVKVKVENEETLNILVRNFEKTIIEDYANVEDSIEVAVKTLEEQYDDVITKDTTDNIIDTLVILPNGTLSMHKYFTDTPECSNNVGNLELDDNKFLYYISVRSSKDSLLDYMGDKLEIIGRLFEYEVERANRLSGWEYAPKSQLKDLMEEQYKITYGENPRFKITHASTECGLFKSALKDLDVISIGPIIYEEHTVNEYMEINSVNELWKFILKILEKAKKF